MSQHRDETADLGIGTVELSPSESEAILKRAAEIDGVDLTNDRAISATALEEAGTEVGISRRAIRQAMQERQVEHTKTLPALDSIRAHVHRPAREATRNLETVLSDTGFAVVDRSPAVSVWEPARSSDASRSPLRGVTRVTASVTPIDDDWSSVVVHLDARARQRLHVGGAASGAAIAALGGWAATAGAWPMTVFVGGAGLALAVSQIQEATSGHHRRLRQAAAAIKTALGDNS